MPKRKEHPQSRVDYYIQTDDLIALFRLDGQNFPILPIEEQKTLAVAAQQGNQEALRTLAQSNLGLAFQKATHYFGGRVEPEDLIQTANLELVKAIPNFDVERGNAVSTFVGSCISYELREFFFTENNEIKVRQEILAKLDEILEIKSNLEGSWGRKISVRELFTELLELGWKITFAHLQVLLQLRTKAVELNQEVFYFQENPESGQEIGEFFAAPDNVEEEVEENLLSTFMRECLNEVDNPQWIRILELYYGLADGKEYTLEEIGEQFEVGREAIRQQKERALDKLRRVIQSKENQPKGVLIKRPFR